MDLFQGKLGFVDVVHASAEGERAGGVVGPLVVGTDDALGRAAAWRDQLRAAVPADVVQRPYTAVVAADHDDRVGIDLDGEPVAGLAQFAGMPRKQPPAAPNPLYINAV